jgi:surface protein
MNPNSRSLFRQLNSLEELDLSSFDTSKVTTMQQMFHSDKSLTELDFSNFDTSNVTSM